MKLTCYECVWREGLMIEAYCYNRLTRKKKPLTKGVRDNKVDRPAWCPRKGNYGGMRSRKRVE